MTQETQSIPNHIGIILDGNRRWAQKRGLPALLGHKQGVENIKRVLDHAKKRGIKMLTVYAFSTENWKRSEEEVSHLMGLFQTYATRKLKELNEQGVQVRVMGQWERLPAKLRTALTKLIEGTKKNTEFVLTLCLSYGGRDELVRAIRKLIQLGKIAVEITEDLISTVVDSVGLPDPDLVIRTSGEQRLSGFLTWQSVYSELYFTPTTWPDFDEAALDAAIDWYQFRDRRYGA